MKTMLGGEGAADAARERKGEATVASAVLPASTLRRLIRLPSESPPGGLACILYPVWVNPHRCRRIGLDVMGTGSTLAHRHRRPARMQARARPEPLRRHRRRLPPLRRPPRP